MLFLIDKSMRLALDLAAPDLSPLEQSSSSKSALATSMPCLSASSTPSVDIPAPKSLNRGRTHHRSSGKLQEMSHSQGPSKKKTFKSPLKFAFECSSRYKRDPSGILKQASIHKSAPLKEQLPTIDPYQGYILPLRVLAQNQSSLKPCELFLSVLIHQHRYLWLRGIL